MENKEEASRVAATASLEDFHREREGVMAAAPCSSSAPLLQPPVSHQQQRRQPSMSSELRDLLLKKV
jgi:hypothetical protein